MTIKNNHQTEKPAELLTQMGLVDATPRNMGKRDKVEIWCAVCEKNKVCVQFYNALHKFKTKGYAAKCKSCLNNENSERCKQRTGERNSFYGKKHTQASIDKIIATRPMASEKGKETSLLRYGTNRPAQSKEIKDKTKRTCLEKYGSDSFLGSDEGQRKKEQGLIDKYGVNNPCHIQESNDKKRATMIDRYGVDHFSKTEEFKRSLSLRRKNSKHVVLSDGSYVVDLCKQKQVNLSNAIRVLRAYGEEALRDYVNNDHSNMNSLESLLLSWNLKGVSRYNKLLPNLPYRPDFVCDNGVFINTDGIYWHSELHKTPSYHYEMRRNMSESGIRIMQFREDEVRFKSLIVQSIISSATNNIDKLDARKCQIVPIPVSQYKDFFVQNHLMSNRHASGAVALFYQNQIVSCMSYLVSGQTLEIARFANKLFTSVRGGFSRLLSHIVAQTQPKIIQSFCDLRYATGASYTRNGFELVGVTQGWNWTDGKFIFNRLSCRANMDERRLTEAEHAAELGLYKIYDAGQAKYVKRS